MQLKPKDLLEKDNKVFYLAYGSNLNVRQMKNRCPSSEIIGTTYINDYKLVYCGYDDELAYLTLEKFKGSYVPAALYELEKKDIRFLDLYEGYPKLYYRENMPISLDDNKYKAFLYLMRNKYSYHIPSYEYIMCCKEGYEYFDFDKSILNQALIDTEVNKRLKKIR